MFFEFNDSFLAETVYVKGNLVDKLNYEDARTKAAIETSQETGFRVSPFQVWNRGNKRRQESRPMKWVW